MEEKDSFVPAPGIPGKVYVPRSRGARKHPCPECFGCQWCADSRCGACRSCEPCREGEGQATKR